MLVFDREEQESVKDGVWRDYEGGIRTKVRPFNPDISRRLRKNAQKGGRLDQDLYDKLIFDHIIADWDVQEAVKEGGEVVGTKPMPCTADNKFLVVRAWFGYRVWLTNTADSLSEDVAQITEAELGNSEGSPAGRRTGRVTEASSSPAPAAG